ncbi:unnamed protein product [Ambrosiozyma monospora]|uniref:Unnamed protein product n=1 Tax=Ambrosiozyma monospora TaxID=43982 RepID=A0ACB5TCJ4_AMBMO|nr:unnamed protein product [Ambrosiozyma monospora]
MEHELAQLPRDQDPASLNTYAAPYWLQYLVVSKRCFINVWRTPSYIWSKLSLVIFTSLFNGFTFFNAGTSLQGMQNQMLSTFMYSVLLLAYGNQILPYFIDQRSLYEVRERPSKTFGWVVFIASQITVEIPWAVLCGTIGYFCWYYPLGLEHNAHTSSEVTERGGLTWLLLCSFYLYGVSLIQMCVSAIELETNAANLASLLFIMCLNFCGVLRYPTGFWSFMYRVSPFTYFIASVLAAGLGNSHVACSEKEFSTIVPPEGQSCQEYMEPYISMAGGYLRDTDDDSCQFCSMSDTNVFLTSLHIEYDKRWRNWGIFICYLAINWTVMFFVYWLFRVPKKNDRVQDESSLKSKALVNVDEKPEEK